LVRLTLSNDELTVDSVVNLHINNDMEIDNGATIKSNDAVECGYQVTNAALGIGSLGSMEGPHLEQAALPTDATLDGFFGDTDGCSGVWRDTDSDSNSRMFHRINGVWYFSFVANL